MPRFHKATLKKTGMPPGSLVHVGEQKVERTRITIIDYDEANFEEKDAATVEECLPYIRKSTTSWINIDGIHDPQVMQSVGDSFKIHPLAMEDIMNTGHRPKMDMYEDYILIIIKMLSYDDANGKIVAEQVSLLLFENLVVSFQERVGDIFDPIRERIRGKGIRIRSRKADYLAYALIDIVVDNYFSILEKLGERIEKLEEALETDPSPQILHSIRKVKEEMILLRRSVWPLREMISNLEKVEMPLIEKSTRLFLRDVYDHTIQVIDTIESDRDILAGMVDLYLSAVSNRMNEVMKVLTIIATIFIPLTFLAGVYGMNFHNMPELSWRWSYPIVLVVMAATAVFMLFYFKRKKWL
jgi:magnesium transporter